ncbi:MAG: hypothetical protein AAGB28_11315 [Pseudomonadota bacterium]
MLQLLNQFDLKPSVTRDRFEAAWQAFVDHLIASDAALSGGPVFVRCPQSGYDTDEERGHRFLALIVFRDQDQADATWAAIEDRAEPIGRLHHAVISLVHDPVFTFWARN